MRTRLGPRREESSPAGRRTSVQKIAFVFLPNCRARFRLRVSETGGAASAPSVRNASLDRYGLYVFAQKIEELVRVRPLGSRQPVASHGAAPERCITVGLPAYRPAHTLTKPGRAFRLARFHLHRRKTWVASQFKPVDEQLAY